MYVISSFYMHPVKDAMPCAVIDTPFSVSMISIYQKKSIDGISIYRHIDEN